MLQKLNAMLFPKVNQLPLTIPSVLRQTEEWQQTHNETRSLIPVVLDQLGEYNTKLTDLQEALDKAAEFIRETEDKNQQSGTKLRDHEVPSSKCTLHLQAAGQAFFLSKTQWRDSVV